MKFAEVERSLQKALAQMKASAEGIETLAKEEYVHWRHSDGVLLPYQKRWVADQSSIKVAEKSRRIGLSWAEACASVLEAARTSGSSTIYVSYNFDMTENFIKDCAFWSKHFHLAASEIEQLVLAHGDDDVLTYQIRFASGHSIKALSGKPNNIRGKQARVIIDEAAFCADLDELLKSSIALLMWGGQIRVISTHNGVDNPFNALVQQIKSGEKNYSLHTTTIDDALDEGLYKRICLTQGTRYTKAGETAWRLQLFRDYGIVADEELLCMPFAASSGKVFNRAWFEIIEPNSLEIPYYRDRVRFWDMAATAKELNKNACYTCGILMERFTSYEGIVTYVIWDMQAEQLSPSEGDSLIIQTAAIDGKDVMVRWELEGGSAGLKVESHLQDDLPGYDADGVRPRGDKLTRAKPFATEAKNGRVKLIRGAWNNDFLRWYHAFDGTNGKDKVNDPIDAGSGAYEVLQDVGSGWLRSV